ncbi:protein neprosin-like [Silene latifolia]|uniref:protein neprosin-like n=1 Tax=Silene latifolia TaxID=37657 RepID=UPI003D783FD1
MAALHLLLFTLCFAIDGNSRPRIANNGQIFNCIDFYKQPAYENHSLNLQEVPNLAKLQQQQSASDFGLEGQRCPFGTVPIMVRSKMNLDGFVVSRLHSLPPYAIENRDLHCSAKVRTRANNPNKKFFGAHASLTIFKPLVQSSQWSSARVKLLNGAESMEAGWMVNPKIFKDNEAHLYGSFSAGGKSCINMDCPGFVQVSTAVPLGVASPVYSVIGGQKFEWSISIEKHRDDGNWWLTVGSVKVGYWPKNLFTALKDIANQVEYGGEIDDPGMVNPPPAMGNGRQATSDTKESSFIYQVTVVDESFNNVNPPDTESFEDYLGYYYSDLEDGPCLFKKFIVDFDGVLEDCEEGKIDDMAD